jgi:hypothetical protein
LHAPIDESRRHTYNVIDFQKIYEPSTAHAGPSYSNGGSHCVASNLGGGNNAEENINWEGASVKCESDGWAWEEGREGMHVHGGGGDGAGRMAMTMWGKW